MVDQTEHTRDLRSYGYAPGGYLIVRCNTCQKQFTGDKRAWNCEACATKLADEPKPGAAPSDVDQMIEDARKCPTLGPTCRGCPDCRGIPYDPETAAWARQELEDITPSPQAVAAALDMWERTSGNDYDRMLLAVSAALTTPESQS